MSARRRIRFWCYNLWLELSALALTAVVLVLAVTFTLAAVNRKYLDLHARLRGQPLQRLLRGAGGHLLGRLDLSPLFAPSDAGPSILQPDSSSRLMH